MGKLIIRSGMTVDGVIDQTDRWFIPDGEHEDESYDQLFAADAFVLGRKTYQGLARVWPTITDDRGFADRVNALPKFVASRTLTEPLEWNSTLIKGDVAEGLRELKRQHRGHLLSYGCGELARYLTAQGLVDEIRFTVFPTVLGNGDRPFGAGGPPVGLRLIGTTMFRSGVALLTYRPEVT
jgi:dihydrofolate reductase